MKNKHDQAEENEKLKNLIDYPLYAENEDIYKHKQDKLDINVEKIGTTSEQSESKLIIDDGLSAGNLENDLDIPGAELDDEDEAIGSEDEENNFYSESDSD